VARIPDWIPPGGDPIDEKLDIGPDNSRLEWLSSLSDRDDPLAILVRCEELDDEAGEPRGTHLEMYYAHHKALKGERK
jgi:hypothetical protein